MQCKCGGDAKVESRVFTENQSEQCLEFSYPKVPESYPIVVNRAYCKSCGRQSVDLSFPNGGVTVEDGHVLHPDGTVRTVGGKLFKRTSTSKKPSNRLF